jgi:hypothetical protein
MEEMIQINRTDWQETQMRLTQLEEQVRNLERVVMANQADCITLDTETSELTQIIKNSRDYETLRINVKNWLRSPRN